jgi:D-arabinose 1-dehydrogenase-like Zn-dependent alcohol dehydrogenase
MTVTGRLAEFYGAGEPITLVEYPVPEPGPGAAVVKIGLANVCGSDLHVWRGELDLKKIGRALPRMLGHEFCGSIHSLGEGVTHDGAGEPLGVGDRVIVRYSFACGRCKACLRGMTRACPNQMQHLATSCQEWPYFKGAFGDYTYLYPGHVAFKVPEDLSDGMVAGLNCAFSTVMCGLDVANLHLGDTVVIQGAGGLGICATAVAKELGAGKVVVVDGVAERLDLAESFGADEIVDLRELRTPERRVERIKELTGGWGAEVVMDVAGAPGVVPEGLQMVGNGGRYIEIGTISPGMGFTLEPHTLIPRNVDYCSVGFYEPHHLKAALDMMIRTRHKYPFHKVVSDIFPLDQINEVMAQQDKGHITRAALKP